MSAPEHRGYPNLAFSADEDASHNRVWRDGVDVTAEDPSTWVFPWSMYVSGRRGPEEAARWLARHERALADRDETQ